MKLSKDYWENRYVSKSTPWDIGYVSTPIKDYIDQLKDKNISILIPGAGNAYEAEYLWQQGFKNIYVVDIAKSPLDDLKRRIPDIPSNQILFNDFFNLDKTFDLIIEQTFFCALEPTLRDKYVSKTYDLLTANGKIAGLFFNFPLTKEGPPFGGSATEYRNRFKSKFKIKTLETSYNSIQPRANKELFFIFEKKNL
ncbi:MAG: methyltransferase [Winogradskyella sp.]|nr:methyltransferase [Winogradskyella sp.]